MHSLSDEQLLAYANTQMPSDQQEEFSNLLDGNREGTLTVTERASLDELMQLYRHGLVQKGKAIKEAVERGLMPPLSYSPSEKDFGL